jgi:hypothetical protein
MLKKYGSIEKIIEAFPKQISSAEPAKEEEESELPMNELYKD